MKVAILNRCAKFVREVYDLDVSSFDVSDVQARRLLDGALLEYYFDHQVPGDFYDFRVEFLQWFKIPSHI